MKRSFCNRLVICGVLAAVVWASLTAGRSERVWAQSPLFPNTRPLEQGTYDGGFGRMLIRPPPPPYVRPATPVYSGYGRGFGPAYGSYRGQPYGNGSSGFIRRYGGAGLSQPLPGGVYTP